MRWNSSRRRCRRNSSPRARAMMPRTNATCSTASRTCLAKLWPALDVHGPLAPLTDGDVDLLLAAVDDCLPTALEEHESGVRIFFATAETRNAAADVIA